MMVLYQQGQLVNKHAWVKGIKPPILIRANGEFDLDAQDAPRHSGSHESCRCYLSLASPYPLSCCIPARIFLKS
jgi:hypothetical protein